MALVLFSVGMVVLGVGAGAINASLGLGGGVIMVPAFIEFAGLDPHTAKGTSLFIIIFIAALNAWRLNRGLGPAPWRTAVLLASGSVVGGYFGGWATARLGGTTVLWLFVGILGVIGLRTFFLEHRIVTDEDVRRRVGVAGVIGVLAGLVSGGTGTGGGAVLVPLALMAGLATNERVVGLSNLVMVATALAATAAHFRAERLCDMPWTIGQVNLALAPLVFVGAQLGSPWGKRLNSALTLGRRRVVMGVLLVVLAGRLIARALA